MTHTMRRIAISLGMLFQLGLAQAAVTGVPALGSGDEAAVKAAYKELIDLENLHDVDAVSRLVWDAPSTVFVAKTATQAEGGWAGFWGKDVVLQHFADLYKGVFRIDPDYSAEKVVALSPDVAQTYVPVHIAVAYAGQTPVPRPFLMILEWVRTPDGWKMATDIALPIPQPQPK